MSAVNYLLTEEQLWCCICLDVFTDPVTLACGHNFCRSCIMQHLSTDPQRKCPMCKETVEKNYKLGVNTFICEMATHLRLSAGPKTSNTSQQHAATPVRLSHDAPAGPEHASSNYFLLVLGLTCTIVFLATSLIFHRAVSSWRSQLVEQAVESMCTEHDQPLELYCKNEQMPICTSCAATNHRYHQVLSVEDEYEVKKTILGKTEAEVQERIQERQLKTQELHRTVELSEKPADGSHFFTALIQSLERARAELSRMTEEEQRATKRRSQSFIVELEEEISELKRWRAEAEQVWRCTDRLRFLHRLPSLHAAPASRDWTDVRVCPVRRERLTRSAMIRAVQHMTELFRNEMTRLQQEEMKDVRQHAVEVTLDPETAHPALILSDDGKQVHCGDVRRKLSNTLKRFELATHVLGKQSFSCGRFHFDVLVKGKTAWTVGVAKESVRRKEETELNPENGYWVVRLQAGNQYVALESSPVPLSEDHRPERVRVFVDYEESQVSFYEVDAAVLLYTFTACSFSEKLYPIFSPGNCEGGRDSDPLIISPLNTT